MADGFAMIDEVMQALNLTGNDYQKDTIQFYIDDVNAYLIDAGVPENMINTKPTAGVVARGVADLWNYGAGDGRLSNYFYQRAIQLATGKEVVNDGNA